MIMMLIVNVAIIEFTIVVAIVSAARAA